MRGAFVRSSLAVAALALCLAPNAHALSLTGATYYTANADGSYGGAGGFWDTASGNGTFNVYFFNGATLLNSDGTSEDAAINQPLATGTYNLTFRYSDDRGTSGMNLYFNGDTSAPKITVHSASGPGGSPFSVTAAGTDTFGIDQSFNQPAAGSGSFTDAMGATVTVLGFSHDQGTNDLVGAFGASPDGGNDGVGTLTLQVTNPVPEPASLAALGLGAIGLLRRRKRA